MLIKTWQLASRRESKPSKKDNTSVMCQTALSEGSNKEFVDLSSSLIRLSGNPSIIQATFTLPSSLQNPWNLLRSTEKEEKPLICKTTLGIEAEEVTF